MEFQRFSLFSLKILIVIAKLEQSRYGAGVLIPKK